MWRQPREKSWPVVVLAPSHQRLERRHPPRYNMADRVCASVLLCWGVAAACSSRCLGGVPYAVACSPMFRSCVVVIRTMNPNVSLVHCTAIATPTDMFFFPGIAAQSACIECVAVTGNSSCSCVFLDPRNASIHKPRHVQIGSTAVLRHVNVPPYRNLPVAGAARAVIRVHGMLILWGFRQGF